MENVVNCLSIVNVNFVCFWLILVCMLILLYICATKYDFDILKHTSKKNKIVISLIVFAVLFVTCINNNSDNFNAKAFEKEEVQDSDISLYGNNKVIIIGDSRMEYIATGTGYDIPNNFSFIALSGSKIDWFEEMASERLKKELDEREKNITYHVIFNMGVNDLNTNADVNDVASSYYNLYKKFAKDYPNVYFYLLSINPIDDNTINKNEKGQKRTNIKIDFTNRKMVSLLKSDNLSNMSYCDADHNIAFNTKDGLHYDYDTNQKIINYISNECVAYK